MKKEWLTQDKDMQIAQGVIEHYAEANKLDALGLFELVLNQKAKRMDFQLSSWVVILAKLYKNIYGAEQGDLVTRLVIARCLRGNETIH